MNGTLTASCARRCRFAVYAIVAATALVGGALGEPDPAAASAVTVIAAAGSSDGYRISTIQIAVQAEAIAIDPGTHTVFVGSNQQLTVVNEQTGAITAAVRLPGSVFALAVDTATHRVYALQQFPQPGSVPRQSPNPVQASIAVIDPQALDVIATYPNLGFGPAFPSTGSTLVDDPAGHRLFSASTNVTIHGIQVADATQIDTVTGAVTALSSGYAANSLAYNPSTETLYVADQSPSRTVTVLSVHGAARDVTSVQLVLRLISSFTSWVGSARMSYGAVYWVGADR